VIVGKAAEIVPMLEKHGPVEVVDVNGQPIKAKLEPAQAAPGATAAPGKASAEPAQVPSVSPEKGAPKAAAPTGSKTP
jgi:hypothetical protein